VAAPIYLSYKGQLGKMWLPHLVPIPLEKKGKDFYMAAPHLCTKLPSGPQVFINVTLARAQKGGQRGEKLREVVVLRGWVYLGGCSKTFQSSGDRTRCWVGTE
jgi:hypothetical protein